jgi:hypothetical protein
MDYIGAMRIRSQLLMAAVFVAGAGTGMLLQQITWGIRPGSTRSADTQVPNQPTQELGAELMGQVGRHFIADSRGPEGIVSGIYFFDTPKPYGLWLCRVNAYRVARKVITGKLERPQDWWEDELALQRRYGTWRRPTPPEAPAGMRKRACAGFRDFDNTFGADEGAEPERAAYLLDTILGDARAPSPFRYPISCTTLRMHSELEAKCDSKSVLRRLSLRRLRHAKTLSFTHEPRLGISRDELSVASSAASTSVRLIVDSEQHWGRHSISEGEVKAVQVEEMVEGY